MGWSTGNGIETRALNSVRLRTEALAMHAHALQYLLY